MANKENEPPNGLEKLFSTQGVLIAILILGFYWVFLEKIKARNLHATIIPPKIFQLE